MRSDAYIRITCDKCETVEEEIQITATARGGYDDRNVDRAIAGRGWTKDGERDFCEDCSKQIAAEEAAQS